jgi:hypothetical protein
MEIEMAKPVKSTVKAATDLAKDVIVKPLARAAGAPTAPQVAAPVAPVAEPEKVAPKSAVSLGGEDQQKATRQMSRRRRAAGVATGSQGVSGPARTQRKTLLGQ